MTYLKDIIDQGGPFDGPLLVKSCERGVASNSSAYLSLQLQDVTGLINAKKWSVEDGDMDIMIPGQVCRFEGSIFKYKGNPQLKIETVCKMEPGSFDPNDFYLSCPLSDDVVRDSARKVISLIQDEDLRLLTETVIKENEERYFTYPAAVTVHHAYRAGIVYHSLCIAKDALAICKNYPFLNQDYLLAGAMLHDIGKTKEMSGVLASNYTKEGNMLGHITMGAMIVEETGKRLNTPEDKLIIILHMILAHHGQPDFGSPVVPMTPEAYVLHVLDDMDAKLNILETSLKDVKIGDFSPRQTFVDGRPFLKTKE